MNLNSNLIGRLMLNELPGLAGAMQPAGGGTQSLAELAGRQHSQNLATAMLSAAAGLLAPSPNRYPLGPLQRLSAGLGAALQSYNGGAQQGGILDALEMDGRAAQPRASGAGPVRPGGAGPVRPGGAGRCGRAGWAVRPARTTSAPAAAEASGAKVLGRITARSGSAARKPASRQPTLEEFTGTLASRLDHPAVLPGGWKLYGYEKEGGRPVYVGPGHRLRVYG